MEAKTKTISFYIYDGKSQQMEIWLEANPDIEIIARMTKAYNSITKEHTIYYKEKK